jgi:hypothetical protein
LSFIICLKIIWIDRVCTVALTWDLRERDHLLRALLLEPKAVHVDVTHLGYPLAIEDALGGRGVELADNPDF